MGIIDYSIIFAMALAIMIGFYHGLIKTALNIAAIFICILLAWVLYDNLAIKILAINNLVENISYYSESRDMLDSIQLVYTDVSTLTPDSLTALLSTINLPHPLENLLTQNVNILAFSSLGYTTMGDYLTMTIVHMSVGIVSFLLIFFSSRLILAFFINMLDYTIKLPVLRHFDSVAGGALGFISGVIVVFIVFSVAPVILAFLPFENLRLMVEESQLGLFFYQGNFIIDSIKGYIAP